MPSARWLPVYFVAPILVPMALGIAILALGGGPRYADILNDLKDPDPKVRRGSLEWLEEIRRPSTGDYVAPLIHDPEKRVREKAVRVLGKTRSPEVLPTLDEAMKIRAAEPKDVLQAMQYLGYPHSFPYLKKYTTDQDPAVARRATEAYTGLIKTLNLEMCFYSVGSPIYNELGSNIHSQVTLFPQGRELVRHPVVMEVEGDD